MTYCVGLQLDAGLIFLSDSRTNAGVDHINRFRKMTIWEQRGERVLTMLSSGNLAVSQSVLHELQEQTTDDGTHMLNVRNLFEAAELVGNAVRKVFHRDAEAMKTMGVEFVANFIIGGQIAQQMPRLFQVYAAGNFIEASRETPYFQIGEAKYGKPILDRIIRPETGLAAAAKCAMVSMDSTIRSNLSVGPPLDLLCYRRDSLKVDCHVFMEHNDPYLTMISNRWGEQLNQAFKTLPDPRWPGLDE